MNLLATPLRRRVLFASLYLSEGAPIGFIWFALPTKLTGAEVPVGKITALIAWVTLPWALKFLWAPLVDVLRGRVWKRKHWIMASQLAMGAALMPLWGLDLASHVSMLFPLLLAHAVAASVQDAAIDALAIAAVPPYERGRINGWMQAGMLLGRSLMGGGALVAGSLLGERFGDETADQIVLAALVGVSWFSLLLVAGAREPSDEPRSGKRAVGRTFAAALRVAAADRNTWLGLLFAGTAGAAYEAAGVLAGPFLTARGFSEHEVGVFFLLVPPVCMVAGALLGGFFSDATGRKRTITAALALFVAAIALLAYADWLASPGAGNLRLLVMGRPIGDALPAVFLVLLAAMYVGIGLFVASSYALLMDVTREGIAATQFSAFMGATNGCEAWSAGLAGVLVVRFGYPPALLIMCAASVLSAALILPRFRLAKSRQP